MTTTLTNDQITAGAAVLCDHGQPIGRNAAIAVADAMQAASPVHSPSYGPVHVVGDLVRNLLTLDQAAPIFTAFHVDIDGKRRCRAQQGITLSRERVIDGKWIDSTRKDLPLSYVAWAKPDERAATSPQVADIAELPPLPERDGDWAGDNWYTADTMRDYASDAIAASRRAAGEPAAEKWAIYYDNLGKQPYSSAFMREWHLYDSEADAAREISHYTFREHYRPVRVRVYATPAPASAGQAAPTRSEDVTKALRELMSIVRIHSDFTAENFAWAEMQYAEEVLAAQPAEVSAGQAVAFGDQWHSLTCDGTCSPPCKDAPIAEGAGQAGQVAMPRNLAQRCLTSMRAAVTFGETGRGRPPAQTCMFEIEELEALLAAPTERAAAPAELTSAARDVLAERRRQVEQEGWTPEHDDQYDDAELSRAAAAYALQGEHDFGPPPEWPWSREWWKPRGERRNLIKAGALILADIERLDRATHQPSAQKGGDA